MNKGLKIFLASIIIIAGIISGCGYLVEYQYKKILANLNYNNSIVKVTGEVELGLFNSTAYTVLTPKIFPFNNSKIDLVHSISHNPLLHILHRIRGDQYKLATIKSKIINPEFAAFETALYQDKHGIDITTAIGTDLLLNTVIEFAPFKVKLDLGELSSSTIITKLQYNPAFNLLKSATKVAEINYSERGNHLILDGINRIDDLHEDPTGIWIGSGQGSVEKFSIKENIATLFSVTNFTYNYLIQNNNQLVNYLLEVNLAELIEKGSNTKIGPFKFTLKLANIDMDALKELQQIDPQYASLQNNLIAEKFILQLLKAEPVLSLENIQCDSNFGNLTASLQTKIVAKKLDTLDYAKLLASIQLTAKVAISKNFAYSMLAKKISNELNAEEKSFELSHEGANMPKPYKFSVAGRKAEIENKVASLIAKMVAEKYLIANGDQFSSEINIQDREIDINGKVLSFN